LISLTILSLSCASQPDIFAAQQHVCFALLSNIILWLAYHHTDEDLNSMAQLQGKITTRQRELDETVRHLSDLTSYSQANVQQQMINLSLRHSLGNDENEGERARFPLAMLPFKQNRSFYGRREEMDKMDQYLKWEGNSPLRTFSIYGRRGVGKTEIALEYAYRNPSRFDAIFWIGCETTLTLRQSFTNMAISKQTLITKLGNFADWAKSLIFLEQIAKVRNPSSWSWLTLIALRPP
jgi:hypothetical protein